MKSSHLTVGQIAKRSGLTVSALHFYEAKGLIASQRNAGNQRRYSSDVLRRIAIIKAAQSLGISLKEIHAAFAELPAGRTPNQADWERLSATWQQGLNERIARLERVRDSLTGCIGCGCLSMKKCPLYNPGDEAAEAGVGAVFLERSRTG